MVTPHNGSGLLTATINGRGADTFFNTPWGSFGFVLRNDAGDDYSDKNVWLIHTLNSLTMDWDLTKGINNWTFNDEIMSSLQKHGDNPEKYFMNGDKVHMVSSSGTQTVLSVLPKALSASASVALWQAKRRGAMSKR